MPDDRVIERYVERFLEALESIKNQFSRIAYAVEAKVLVSLTEGEKFVGPCKACGCRLLIQTTDECPACQTYIGAC